MYSQVTGTRRDDLCPRPYLSDSSPPGKTAHELVGPPGLEPVRVRVQFTVRILVGLVADSLSIRRVAVLFESRKRCNEDADTGSRTLVIVDGFGGKFLRPLG